MSETAPVFALLGSTDSARAAEPPYLFVEIGSVDLEMVVEPAGFLWDAMELMLVTDLVRGMIAYFLETGTGLEAMEGFIPLLDP